MLVKKLKSNQAFVQYVPVELLFGPVGAKSTPNTVVSRPHWLVGAFNSAAWGPVGAA
jgi:hypothetical protein